MTRETTDTSATKVPMSTAPKVLSRDGVVSRTLSEASEVEAARGMVKASYPGNEYVNAEVL